MMRSGDCFHPDAPVPTPKTIKYAPTQNAAKTFTLTDEEMVKVHKFMKEEDAKTGGDYGAIGGAYTYSFTPTSIGVITKVTNGSSNAVLDLSDYDSW